MNPPDLRFSANASRWQRLARALVSAFQAYGAWLAGISWLRFIILALLLLIGANVVQNIPPFSWKVTETVTVPAPRPVARPKPPAPPPAASAPRVVIEREASPAGRDGVSISIDEHGVRILKVPAAAGAASAASSVTEVVPPRATVQIHAGDQDVRIALPPGADSEAVREAVDEARAAIVEAIHDAKEAAHAAEEIRASEAQEVADQEAGLQIHEVRLGDFLPDLALFWAVASAILKITYKGRIQAEAKAAQATETAEAESLKRQVVEARMAAMQAQVEPHFLFNTLASIDHLIETDPPRASQMQRNLIALLRASMPTLRDTADGAPRDLGRELAVVRPYVEILKVRMEERLDARIEVPEGLFSAEFPSMMMQTLVENAIRHGLEPKPEGGALVVKAEIVHGKLAVTVADTGVGFGRGGTSGTGVGLTNIRERLQMLYGSQAALTVAENMPSGTRVTIAVPYRSVAGTSTAA